MTDATDARTPPEYYADATFIRWNTFGFRLEVGLSGDADGLRRVDAVVNMSPQMALSLAALLQTQVDVYQSAFGPLNLTPVHVQSGETGS